MVPVGTPAGVTVNVPPEDIVVVWFVTLGVGGCARIVTLVPVDVHPAELRAVTVYVPGITLLKIPVLLV